MEIDLFQALFSVSEEEFKGALIKVSEEPYKAAALLCKSINWNYHIDALRKKIETVREEYYKENQKSMGHVQALDQAIQRLLDSMFVESMERSRRLATMETLDM